MIRATPATRRAMRVLALALRAIRRRRDRRAFETLALGLIRQDRIRSIFIKGA